MKNLLFKELHLSTPLLTFLFLAFSLMTFIPGYPTLMGVFFVCFGIFQSYQFGREDNDILYTVLLPIKKSDAVGAKFASAAVLQMVSFLFFTAFTLVRMMFLPEVAAYKNNALMGANFTFLAFALLIFAAFNVIFIGGFFKTAYKIGKPFIVFITVSIIIIAAAEALHHLPYLSWTNTLDFSDSAKQIPVLALSAVVYVFSTLISCNIAKRRFEKIDL
ncbi:MAG: ABC-2 transporter permease [Clostridia bacterium]|nr:ABC-2 transporter permease [Clostridia bacterium]